MNDFFVWSLQSAAPVVVVSDDGTAVEAVRAYLDTLDPIPDLSSELTVYATPRGEGPVTVFAVGIVETGTIG